MSEAQLFGRKAREWIVAAGSLVMKGMEEQYAVEMKSKTDPVTEIDFRCEQFLKEKIINEFPDHKILAEESDPWKTHRKSGGSLILSTGPPIFYTVSPIFVYPLPSKKKTKYWLPPSMTHTGKSCFTAIRKQREPY